MYYYRDGFIVRNLTVLSVVDTHAICALLRIAIPTVSFWDVTQVSVRTQSPAHPHLPCTRYVWNGPDRNSIRARIERIYLLRSSAHNAHSSRRARSAYVCFDRPGSSRFLGSFSDWSTQAPWVAGLVWRTGSDGDIIFRVITRVWNDAVGRHATEFNYCPDRGIRIRRTPWALTSKHNLLYRFVFEHIKYQLPFHIIWHSKTLDAPFRFVHPHFILFFIPSSKPPFFCITDLIGVCTKWTIKYARNKERRYSRLNELSHNRKIQTSN